MFTRQPRKMVASLDDQNAHVQTTSDRSMACPENMIHIISDRDDVQKFRRISIDSTKLFDSSSHEPRSSKINISQCEMSKFLVLKNLAILSLGFFLLFCGYKGLANLQSTMNREEGVGVISQSVIYLGFLVSALVLPKMFIRYLGCKKSIVLSILAYSPYIAANVYPHFGTIIPTSVLLGLAAGPLWAAQSVYLTEIANRFSTFTTANKEFVLSVFFGAFLMIYGTTDVWGNLVSYYVLKPGDPGNDTLNNQQNISLLNCGIDFCFSSGKENSNLVPPSDEKRYILTSIYLLCAISAAVIVAAFLNPLERKVDLKDSKKEGILSLVGATLKNCRRVDQLLLVPICIFSGAERAFLMGEFTMGYIACAWGIYHVGYVCVCYGATVAIVSLVSGYLLKCMPRTVIMASGCVANLCACVGMILWDPRAEESHIFFILAAIWGFTDAIFHTHIRALLGSLFKDEKEGAFSNYLLFESVGNVIIFGSSKYLCMRIKLGFVIFLLVTGIFGYFCVEIRLAKRKLRNYVVT